VRIFVELSARFFVARPSAFAVGCFGGMEARYEVAEAITCGWLDAGSVL
jgi:hypothetical protein